MSSSTGALPATFGHPVTEKLTKSDFALWKLQVLHAICGAQLTGFIDGTFAAPLEEIDGKDDTKVPNPAYSTWLALDQ
jgi:hypothetical protein